MYHRQCTKNVVSSKEIASYICCVKLKSTIFFDLSIVSHFFICVIVLFMNAFTNTAHCQILFRTNHLFLFFFTHPKAMSYETYASRPSFFLAVCSMGKLGMAVGNRGGGLGKSPLFFSARARSAPMETRKNNIFIITIVDPRDF